MRKVIGLLMILAGIILGLYIGFYVCLIGGVVQILTQLQQPHIIPVEVATGIAKIMGAGLAGGLSGVTLIAPGRVIFES